MNPTTRPRTTLLAPTAALAAIVAMAVPVTASAASPSASAVTPSATSATIATTHAAATSRLVHIDRTHDVQRSTIEGETLEPAPARKDVDIRRVVARYAHNRVVLSMTTRAPMPRRGMAVIGTLRTPSADYEVLHSRLFGAKELQLTRGARSVRCDGLRTVRDRRTFRLVVPASCIGTPKRVQVGLGGIVMKRNSYFVDDGLASRAGDNLARSRWIR